MKPDQDWPSVWPGPRTFHPASVPLPVRQGFAHLKGQSTPGKYANVELMKIPNFLHLTPPAIKRHCDAIKKFCTPWPKGKIKVDLIALEIWWVSDRGTRLIYFITQDMRLLTPVLKALFVWIFKLFFSNFK